MERLETALKGMEIYDLVNSITDEFGRIIHQEYSRPGVHTGLNYMDERRKNLIEVDIDYWDDISNTLKLITIHDAMTLELGKQYYTENGIKIYYEHFDLSKNEELPSILQEYDNYGRPHKRKFGKGFDEYILWEYLNDSENSPLTKYQNTKRGELSEMEYDSEGRLIKYHGLDKRIDIDVELTFDSDGNLMEMVQRSKNINKATPISFIHNAYQFTDIYDPEWVEVLKKNPFVNKK